MANLIDILAVGVEDDSGLALENGLVYFYEAGTTTPKTVYQDAEESLPHSNPATLDAAGKLFAYTTGKIKLVIEDSDGGSVRTIDDIGVGLSTSDVSTTAADSVYFSGSNLSEVIDNLGTSLGANALYKYKTVGNQRTYLSRGADRVSVKDFGAVGDGVTDDTAAINSAISNLSSGAVLYFPAGTYKCTSDITVNIANITLYGESRASKIQFPADGSNIYITADYVVIDGLHIDGTSASSSVSQAYGIFAEGEDSDRLQQIHVRNCIITNWARGGVQLAYTEHSSVKNCHIENAYYLGIGAYSSKYYQIHGNFIKNIVADGVLGTNAYGIIQYNDYGVDEVSEYGSIIGNWVEDCSTWEGIDSHSASDFVIANNVVKGCLYAISMQSRDDESQIPQNILVSSNVCIGTSPANGTDGGAGIEYYGGDTVQAKNVVITGNVVRGFGKTDNVKRAGIRTRLIDGCVISNNTIHDCAPNGIHCDYGHYGLSITGNTIVDAYSNSITNPSAIYMDGSSGNNCLIANNSFEVDDNSNTYVMVNGIFLSNATDRGGTRIGLNYSECTNYIEHEGFAEDYGYHGGLQVDPFYALPLSASGPSRTNKQWYQGDWIRNSDPDRYDPIGWICLADSTPSSDAGTWLKMPPMINWGSASSIPSGGTQGDITINSDPLTSNPWGWMRRSGEWGNMPGGAVTPGAMTTVKRIVWQSSTPQSNAPGNALAWNVGDICFNSAPAGGSPKGWMCTSAGTPGTWTSMGNL